MPAPFFRTVLDRQLTKRWRQDFMVTNFVKTNLYSTDLTE